MSYKSFFDGIGSTQVHMFASIVMNVANLILNWVLIFGAGPIPQMNVSGAGLGSLISTYIGLACMVGWSFVPKYRRRYMYYRWKNLSRRVIRDIVRVSVPSGFATFFVMAGFAMFIKVVGELDVRQGIDSLGGILFYTPATLDALTATAGHPLMGDSYATMVTHRPPVLTSATKIIMDILSLSFMSMIALGTATATLVGQSLGRGRPERAAEYGWVSVRIGVAIMLLFCMFASVFPEWFISVFNPSPEVIAAGVPSLQLMASSAVFIAVGLVLAQALFGAGMTRYVMWVELLLHSVLLVPLSFLMGFVFDFGLVGVWFSAWLYILLLAVAMAWKFREGGWKKVVL